MAQRDDSELDQTGDFLGQDAGMMEEDMPVEEDFAAEAAPEDQVIGTTMSHTVDDIPELSNYNVGDTVMFKITNVSDDGVYEMSVQTEGEEVLVEDAAVEGAGPEGGMPLAGREEVEQALL